jgi:hypothetical protein
MTKTRPFDSTDLRQRAMWLRLAGAGLLVVILSISATASAAPWRKLYTKEGVTVSAQERPGSDLPILRGVGILPTNLYLLLAIVDDVPRHTEWVYRLERSKMLWRPDPWHARVYLRFNFPWPTSDRDAVVKIEIKRRWFPHHEVFITFADTVDKRMPPLDGVVRVPRTIGFTRLRWLGPNHTHIVYQIDTDPSGSLPKWLVRWLSESLPLRIVRGLRKQLKTRASLYGRFMKAFDPRVTPQKDASVDYPLPGVDLSTLPGRKTAAPPAP